MKSVDILLTFTSRFCVCSKQLKKLLTHQRRRNVQKSGTAHWQIPKARLGGVQGEVLKALRSEAPKALSRDTEVVEGVRNGERVSKSYFSAFQAS